MQMVLHSFVWRTSLDPVIPFHSCLLSSIFFSLIYVEPLANLATTPHSIDSDALAELGAKSEIVELL